MGCTNLEVLLAESLVRVDGLGLGQLLDRRCPHGLNTTSLLYFGTKQVSWHKTIFLALTNLLSTLLAQYNFFSSWHKTDHRDMIRGLMRD